ncbi:MAG: hypothetical protein A2X19_02205 [Bacteroidetes bacterium GWE2_39_28]|nr:MAG: hypothetical protein A2X19_02205 [Bacteroidetes bacterium GWE2_39_28]OFY12040.1 MAG: hypothetical protein A2X16_05835 [Bacteroidetes bacterium GWF2_39_10]OFZ09022.1 MAG: hypothetical protein A2322_03335 [Bacteroidetes bacterium RIFOXYB2_FULL_39_7]OFZ11295.1 MAG: hypothetical protein A2465_09185 [Bacteroidetes bacterium RIFOXYC2_FULL_39_11]HCT95148.1 hypothetical protein [Rikenellaceae bacterium]
MKEDNIKRFFDEHKQTINDEGFSERLFATLDCLPQPVVKKDRSRLIMMLFAIAGFLIFVLLGGYSAVIEGLSSLGGAFSDVKSATPEIVVSFLLSALAIFALGKFVTEEIG